jgi:hypothetical protein
LWRVRLLFVPPGYRDNLIPFHSPERLYGDLMSPQQQNILRSSRELPDITARHKANLDFNVNPSGPSRTDACRDMEERSTDRRT